MPVIIAPEDRERWLKGPNPEELLRPYPAEDMTTAGLAIIGSRNLPGWLAWRRGNWLQQDQGCHSSVS